MGVESLNGVGRPLLTGRRFGIDLIVSGLQGIGYLGMLAQNFDMVMWHRKKCIRQDVK